MSTLNHTVTDVAEVLGLTPSAVSNMVRRLAARGFVNYERYRGFSLTTKGRGVAARTKARHEILSELLSQMGLDADTVGDLHNAGYGCDAIRRT